MSTFLHVLEFIAGCALYIGLALSVWFATWGGR